MKTIGKFLLWGTALAGITMLCLGIFSMLPQQEPTLQGDIQIEESTAVIEPEGWEDKEGENGQQEETPFVPQTDPDWEPENYGGYTMPEKAQMSDGSVGVLGIPKINLSVPVYESEDEMEAMKKGIAHYKMTSAWDGNVGLCGHNGNASYSYFDELKELQEGDTLTYETALGTRTYEVADIREILETDWSMLTRTEDNRITMTTCVDGKPNHRLCVQAVECERSDTV